MSSTSPATGAAAARRERWITVSGARTHNLRDVSVRVPKGRLTVVTGVSGSGKSSLVFDTVAAEAQRLVADTYPAFVRSRLPRRPRPDVDALDGLTFTTVVDQRPFSGNARSTVGTAADIAPLLRMVFSRAGRPSAGYSPAYSFNDPAGMCPRCEGLGRVDDVDVDALVDQSRSLRDGAIRFPSFAPGTFRWKRYVHAGLVDPDVPLREVPPAALDTLMHAENLRLENPDPEYPRTGLFEGILPRFRRSYLRTRPARLTAAEQEALARVVTRRPCPECGGTRLNAAARASLVGGLSLADWSALPLDDLLQVVMATDEPRVAPALRAVADRLAALSDVGLGYLSLDRESSTLSGGEAQRVMIVRHLGSALSGVTYVFDEPSAGLHPHDVHRLTGLLARLRDAGNTVLVVEHHPAVLAAADHVLDLGPGAGGAGGTVLYAGPPSGLRDVDTPTARAARAPLRLRTTPRPSRGVLRIDGARAHNLRDVTVDVPLGVLTAVTGVAGSGKSTLVTDELPRQHPDVTVVDRVPLRGGSRSTPLTVLEVAEPVRAAFARATGLDASWFSPNGRGACPACRGKGVLTTDLAFLEDVETPCDACGGSRFNPTALGARLDGRTIADVLAMTGAQAAELVRSRPEVGRRLGWLDRVGLGYLALGRGVDTLSGGERHRLQLAAHLGTDAGTGARRRLVLDEPTTGLHAADVDRLVDLLDELVDGGTTVVVVEHDLRVVARADHVIDLGPGAGRDGGTVVYQGPPAGMAACAASVTGRYLRSRLEPARG